MMRAALESNGAGSTAWTWRGEECIIALGMHERRASVDDIARALNHSVESVREFLALNAPAPLPAHSSKHQSPAPSVAAVTIRDEDKADYLIVAPPYTLGVAPFSILNMLNRARRAAGQPEATMAHVHQLALAYDLKRPEPPRPAMLPPK